MAKSETLFLLSGGILDVNWVAKNCLYESRGLERNIVKNIFVLKGKLDKI